MFEQNTDFQEINQSNQVSTNHTYNSLITSTEKKKEGERSLLISALTDVNLTDVNALHRKKIDTSRSAYSGYLFKRSNKPHWTNEVAITATDSVLPKTVTDTNVNCISIIFLNFMDSVFGYFLRVAALFIKKLKLTLTKDCKSSTTQPPSHELAQTATTLDNDLSSSMLSNDLNPNKDSVDSNGSDEGSIPDSQLINLQRCGSPIPPPSPKTCSTKPITHDDDVPTDYPASKDDKFPPDYHDPKDGHIWHSKYCVLENGFLYFYRDAQDGNSIEAQEERDQAFSSNVNNNVKCIPNSGVTKSVLNNDVENDGCLEVDHLAQSPTPRSYLRTVPTTKETTGDLRSSYILDPNSVMWEKRVALDRVGSVLASEADFGKHSFVLLGIDSNDDYHDINKNTTMSSPVEKNDEKTYDNNIAAIKGDRLILRAASADAMGNWIAEINRSLQIYVNNVDGNEITVKKENSDSGCKSCDKLNETSDYQSINKLKGTGHSTIEVLNGNSPTDSREVKKYIPPQRRVGKYIPPHKRNEEERKIDPAHFSLPKVNSLDKTEEDEKCHSNNGNIGFMPQSSFSDVHIEPSRKLGGCANTDLIKGSICDPIYIKKKASVVNDADSEPYGAFGGCPSSGKAENQGNMKWEVGAVSKCGSRSSNEDSYIVLNNVLGEATIKDETSSFFKLCESSGIFAIFDGHCGNHAARFAAENFPPILLDESMKDELLTSNGKQMSDEEKGCVLLHNTVARLDDEFCKISMADGRDWESGATALIAVVIRGTLVVAGLGDSHGVLCQSTPRDSSSEEDGWTILNTTEDTYNSESNDGNVEQGVDIKWTEIIKPHSPSREDEKQRIEEANGWVVADPETEKISRVCGDLAVSRALGDREFKAAYNNPERYEMNDGSLSKKWGSAHLREEFRLFPEPSEDHYFIGDVISPIPEVNSFDLGGKGMNEFLVLACDGLWDVMTTIDATRITHDLLFKRGFNAKASADYLVERAFTLGSRDNVTVIVVRFHENERN